MGHRIILHFTFRRIFIEINANGDPGLYAVGTRLRGHAIEYDIIGDPSGILIDGGVQVTGPGIDPATVVLHKTKGIHEVIGHRNIAALKCNSRITRRVNRIVLKFIIVAIHINAFIAILRHPHPRKGGRPSDGAILDRIIVSDHADPIIIRIIDEVIIDVQISR